MTSASIMFYLLLFTAAFLYSSVGHGGASGYLALMIFFSYPPETIRSLVLLLNIFVSGIAFIQYYRAGHFKWNIFWPFAITSIPAAFMGGLVTVDVNIYKKIIAVLLILSALRLSQIKLNYERSSTVRSVPLALLIGACIGFFSGMIGIGGGIILSPLLLFLNWADIKSAAAVSALFIFVNSAAGLAGASVIEFEYKNEFWVMLFLVVAGGTLGSYLGAKKLESKALSRLLAAILLIASIKLISF